ncbi:RDD family protein [Streptomyces polyrhachis]|uniref:RDD family protein n=1 Tax=Streptomyces polyrhachis TaxID=1282885 RepID=A0ABW2GQ12_9ACTN
MDRRQAAGSWLSGPRAAAESMGVDFGYRGEQLGLPREGRGSIAPVGRRIAALYLDWMLCWVIAYGLFAGGEPRALSLWTLAVYFLLAVLTVGTIGVTPGKRLLGIRVVGADGARLGFVRSALRALLVCLIVPAVVWDRDTRGLHDRLARSVEVRI